MAVDHRRILATAIGRLRGKIKYRPVVFELMPPAFTLLQLQRTVEALAGVRLHKQNFRRLVEQQGLVEETGEISARTGGRPARLVRFRREVLLERPAPGLRLRPLPAAAGEHDLTGRRRPRLSHPSIAGSDVGTGKVAALEQQFLAGRLRQGIGEAVADIQRRRMPAAAEPAERIDGQIGLTRIDRDALDFTIVEKRTQIAQALGPFSAEQDHRRFNEADHRYQPDRIGIDSPRANASHSGSPNRHAITAEVSMTITTSHSRRSR